MKPITTEMHGMLDYLYGGAVLVGPWLFQFAQGGPETWIPVIAGCVVIAYSLFTDYEDSFANLLPMRVHLLLDGAVGLFLVFSPWVFGFSDRIWWPHVLIGATSIGIAALTRVRPGAEHAWTKAHPA
jgi:hypothetical protein